MPLILTRRLQPLRGWLDLAPVVNIVLLLLLFFLLGSSFVLQPGIKVEPPQSAAAIGLPSSRLIVAITLAPAQVDSSGQALPRQPILYFNDQLITMDDLRKNLDQLSDRHPGITSLVLKADRNVPLELLTQIMDTAFTHRLAVVIATQPPPAR